MSSNFAVNHPSIEVGAINAHGNTLVWAVICSILLHALLAYFIPNLKFDSLKNPDILVVELSKKPEPPPVILPEPAKNEPAPVIPKTPTKVEPKPDPKPTIKAPTASTTIKSEPAAEVPQPSVAAPTREVIAVTPKADVTPTQPAPIAAPEPPPQPAGPSQEEIDAARGRYGNTLWGAIAKYKQYPRIAQMKGWQGEVMLELQLDGNGKLKSKKVLKSSGYESLDKQALEMVEQAAPFPTPPEALHGSNFSIKVPVPFKLEEQ